MLPIFLDLVENISVLLALCMVYMFLYPRLRHKGFNGQLITGAIFGLFCVLSMMMPLRYAPGIFFDGRTIIISLAGFFSGVISAIITAAAASVYCLYIGGSGTTMGVSVIVASALIGMLFHRLRRSHPSLTGPRYLYLFGLLVHGVMVALIVTLPPPHRIITFKTFLLPVLSVYPLGTLLIGTVLARLEFNADMQAKLARSESDYRHLVENAGSAILRWKPDGTITFINSFGVKLFGYNQADLVGRNLIGTIVPEQDSAGRNLAAMIADISRNPDAFINNENENLCSDGRRVWMAWSNHGVRDASGTVVEILSVGNDMTEKRDYELRLQLLAAAVENATDNIVITDGNGMIQYVNATTCASSGVPAEQIIGTNLFFPPVKTSVPTSLLDEIWATVSSGRVWSGTLVNRTRTGVDMLLDSVITPIRDQSGDSVHYVSISRDRTREKELEQQLRRAQKMEALGTLAGGIAHDFNNILAGMTGYLEVAQDELPADSPVQTYLKRLLGLADRAADLVRQILAFSRNTRGDRRPVLLNTVVGEAIKLLRATIPASIEIRERIDARAVTVVADPTQMHQIIMNLGSNAAHAMEQKGGTLEIFLDCITLDADTALASQGLAPGRYARLRVSDTGTGIAPDIIDKIFDPFFTTKEVGRGTGLGLAVVHGIVREHGGAIRVESMLGSGATFTVLLPVQEGAVPEHPQPAETGTNLRGSERILLVDDEPVLVDTISQMLQRFGYKVTTAQDGAEAWQLFSTSPESFDMVITDQTMPQMSGFELAKKIRCIRPETPVILCTGYSDCVTPDQAAAAGIAAFLEKPVSVSAMALRVREIFDKPSAAQ